MSGGKATNEKIARHSQLRECQKRKSQYMQPESAKSQSGLGRATKAVKLDSQWSSYQRVGVNLGQPDQLLGPVLTGQVVPPLTSDFNRPCKTTSTTPRGRVPSLQAAKQLHRSSHEFPSSQKKGESHYEKTVPMPMAPMRSPNTEQRMPLFLFFDPHLND
jgi:hypothetical protein